MAHSDLVSDWYQAFGEVVVVFLQKLERYHQEVDIVEYKRSSVLVLALAFDEAQWMVSPVPTWVQVVRRVPSVIETISVALQHAGKTC
jgi:hypothetical protein